MLATAAHAEPPGGIAPTQWEGAYAGIAVGGGTGALDIGDDQPWSIGTSGAIVGGQFGLNARLNGIIFGIEGDVAKSWLAGVREVPEADFLDARMTPNWLASVRARLGVEAGRFFIYGTAGAAIASVTATAVINSQPNGSPFPVGSYPDTTMMSGIVVGAGAETMITEHTSLRLEYRYYNLGDGHVDPLQTGDGAPLSAHFQTLTTGMNIHF